MSANSDLHATSRPMPGGWREIGNVVAQGALDRFDVVDVREPHEYAEGHIAGATLAPLGTLPGSATGWRRDRPVLVVCRSGGRSARASGILAAAGFAEVYNLEGGMLAWAASGLPTER